MIIVLHTFLLVALCPGPLSTQICSDACTVFAQSDATLDYSPLSNCCLTPTVLDEIPGSRRFQVLVAPSIESMAHVPACLVQELKCGSGLRG